MYLIALDRVKYICEGTRFDFSRLYLFSIFRIWLILCLVRFSLRLAELGSGEVE